MSAPPTQRKRRGSAGVVPEPARGLPGLKDLKRRLQEADRAHEQHVAQAHAAEQAARRERELFALTVGKVTPLKGAARAVIGRARPEPLPLQRQLDERAVLREALSDDFDAESLLHTDEALSYRAPGIGTDVPAKLRRGTWAIQAQLDLHGLRRDAARESLAAFLRDAGQRGLRCVRIVHGKGHGSPGGQAVLKAKVRSWLVQKEQVLAFVQARPAEGGAGALVVLLGPSPATPAD